MDASFATLGLWGLFASSFLSATLLPKSHEGRAVGWLARYWVLAEGLAWWRS